MSFHEPDHCDSNSQRTDSVLKKLMAPKLYFEVGIKGCELFLSHFLIDSSYLDELLNNSLFIVRQLGMYVVGDEKLFRFFGESDNVRVAFASVL